MVRATHPALCKFRASNRLTHASVVVPHLQVVFLLALCALLAPAAGAMVVVAQRSHCATMTNAGGASEFAQRPARRAHGAMMSGGDASETGMPKVPSRVGGMDNGGWLIERARLEQRRSDEILRRKPRYASFATTCAMVQALGLSTEEEWLEFQSLGEYRSPYIPTNPKEYYEERNAWLGWKMWLTGEP